MKVVSKILALESYQKSFDNCLLLESTTFLYVFYLKERFSNLKRFVKKQKLLYSGEIIPIKGWREMTLSLRIKNQNSILVLKNVNYVSGFLLNLVLLAVLENQGFI